MKNSKFQLKLEKAIADNNAEIKANKVVAGEDNVQEDTITVFKNKLLAFAKAAEELDNAWDYVAGEERVENTVKNLYPFDNQFDKINTAIQLWKEDSVKKLNKL